MPKHIHCEQVFHLTIEQVTNSFGISQQTVVEIIDQGIINPTGKEPKAWHFHQHDMKTLSTVLKLQRDLGVNFAGAALALELLDEISRLQQQVINNDN